MPRSKHDEDFNRPNPGSGRNSPRVSSRRESYDVYGGLYYDDSSPEIDRARRSNDRPSRKTSIRDRNYFTDALDDLERSLRKYEEESSVILHDYGTIKTQHQNQSRRINDLLRYFEETRYRIDKIIHRGFRGYGSDLASDSSSEHRSSTHSLDRGERSGSFKDHRSRSKRMDESPSDRSDHRSRSEIDN